MLGVISIIVGEPDEKTALVNSIIKENKKMVKGRLGIPFSDTDKAVIILVVEGEINEINALSGKIGRLKGISSKVTFEPKES